MNGDMGSKIHHLRVINNNSQETMASKLNVSRQAISKWENNISVPDLDTLKRITQLYDIHMSYFTDDNVADEKIPKNNLKALFFPETSLYKCLIALLSLLAVSLLGPFSLFITVPYLFVNIRQRNVLWSLFYLLLVVIGFHILMTILFPGLMPYSINIKRVND